MIKLLEILAIIGVQLQRDLIIEVGAMGSTFSRGLISLTAS